MVEIKPVLNWPAVTLGRTLVITDLHLGFEFELWKQGIRVPIQTDKVLDRITELIKQKKAKKLIILGDIKHELGFLEGRQAFELSRFLHKLEEIIEFTLMKGNHDGALNWQTEPASGILYKGIGLFHGHAWPASELVEAKSWLMGHVHPMFSFKDSFGKLTKEACWIVGSTDTAAMKKKYGQDKAIKTIVMPAFSELAGGVPVNQEGLLKPMSNLIKQYSVFLLDGVELPIKDKLDS
ncbi:MAG: metallophosphoesterase [Candidatus Altiarchaeota archaeon]|nr:metallophosphoesterase [Candidatus Altiarchaeota archaeon]